MTNLVWIPLILPLKLILMINKVWVKSLGYRFDHLALPLVNIFENFEDVMNKKSWNELVDLILLDQLRQVFNQRDLMGLRY